VVRVCCLRYSPHDRWRAGYHVYPEKKPAKAASGPRPLSARHRRTLAWLAEYRAKAGRWPWLHEAAEALGMTRRGVERHLDGLANRGLVRVACGPGRAKAAELVEGG
jgi:DNA-binding MarR family transcriptional regulator